MKKKNKLLIGASSPVGYFYGFDREKIYGKPCPILESPLSYFLLYDEIWFLSRYICPPNLENLEFVHFIDEELMREGLPLDFINVYESPFGNFPWDTWNGVIENTIGRRWSYDNHSRSMSFGDLQISPTPGNYANLVVDRYVASKFDMDLVENTANAAWSQRIDKDLLQLNITEQLLNSKIASIQTIDGPWHPEILNLRTEPLLKSFRRKAGTIEIKELDEIDKKVSEISKQFEKVTHDLVQKNFETTGLFYSAASFLIGFAPIIGNIVGGAELLKDIRENIELRKEKGWVGFLGKAHHTMKNKSS